ncbi:hypothetical protein BH09SUM1_BH09SUM1_25270 [soil metagenome]
MNFWKKAHSSDRGLLSMSVLCLAISLSLLGFKYNEARAAAAAENDEKFLRFVDTAAEVYTEIKNNYVDEPDTQKVLDGALAGMFTALDEHSQYMDPKMLDSLNRDTGGNFSGIGIHITQRQGLLTVITPIPGTPSAAAGIMPWDRIIEIDGKTTEGMELQDAVDKLTGPSGTKVTIKVYREGSADPLEFTLTRANIKIDSVFYHMLEDKVGYLRIARFSDLTGSDMRKGLLDMKAQGMQSLILDLRFNTGGLLREAVEVSNFFVPKGELIVSTKGRLKNQNSDYMAEEDPLIDLPTFVLVNEGSASASEIVAGALQDHHLGVIVGPQGKNTFGKGSVQTIEYLKQSMYEDDNGNPKKSALRLTTARYYTPSGRTIHHIGITPDIGIALPENNERDLLRHGLYGDTAIPLTVEEKNAVEARKNKEKKDASSSEGIIIQRIEDQKDPAEEKPEPGAMENENTDGNTPPAKTDDKPFYANAKKPELATDEFRDVMLDEAAKQLKIFMILNTQRGQDVPKVAVAPADLSRNAPRRQQ